jgi:predicted ATPase
MDSARIAAVKTVNYRNLLLQQSLMLDGLSVFIGPNGSGKSNFIAVLEFLKNCIVGASDESQSASGFENAVALLGGARLLDKAVKPPSRVKLEYLFSPPASGIVKPLTFDLTLFVGAKNSKISIAEESLSEPKFNSSQPFYYYRHHKKQAGEGVISVYDNESKRSSHFEKVEDAPTDALGLVELPKLLESSKSPPELTPVYSVRRRLIDDIKRWRIYNANYMNLEHIRSSEPRLGPRDVFLSSSGHNLALVIENLIQNDIDFEENLNNAMKSIIPWTRRFRPVRTGLMSLNLEWHFEGMDDCLYLNEMSDGTVRMLCWATLLLSPTPPTLIVIDEPELGIHASWMPILADWIKRASRRTQVIVCTHSPDLLDNFTDCPENVLCFSALDKTHFSAAPLSKPKLSDKLQEGWKLGDLYRVGDPSIGGWPW